MAAHKARKETQALNDQMLDLYFEEGWSQQRVADDPRFNRSIHTVRALIREAKQVHGRVRKKTTTYDPRRRENWKGLSSAHIKLGVLTDRYMAVHSMNATQFGLAVALTRNQVARLGSGAYDLKLTDLVRICKLLDIEIESIFKGMHKGNVIRAPLS
jgi:DNA-binding Xre family transcriptional regulator